MEQRPMANSNVLPLSEFSFCKPLYITHQSAWIEHAPFAFWLVNAHQPRCIVELGTYAGYSYFSFCQAACLLDEKIECYAIDTWEGDEHAGHYPQEVFQQVKEYNGQHYAGISHLVKSTFNNALSLFKNGTIDLLHIDGNHSYESVKEDFLQWLPKMSSKGIILFHDTQVKKRGFGVHKLWKEVSCEYPHFEFTHGFGLGVLGVGTQITDSIVSFLNKDEMSEYASSIRFIYSQLGGCLSNEAFSNLSDETLIELAASLKLGYCELAATLADLSPAAADALLRIAQQESAASLDTGECAVEINHDPQR